jgi:hypothetical protein
MCTDGVESPREHRRPWRIVETRARQRPAVLRVYLPLYPSGKPRSDRLGVAVRERPVGTPSGASSTTTWSRSPNPHPGSARRPWRRCRCAPRRRSRPRCGRSRSCAPPTRWRESTRGRGSTSRYINARGPVGHGQKYATLSHDPAHVNFLEYRLGASHAGIEGGWILRPCWCSSCGLPRRSVSPLWP